MHDESPAPPLHLTAETRSALEALLGRHSAAQSLVRRARIVLMSADGASAARIGVALGCSERVVRKWRARFRSDPRLASLADRPRSGRPARVAVATRCRLVQLACERPSDTTPFREVWTYRTLAEALHAATGVRVSVSEVGRILRFDELRPHRVQQWLHSPDPEFAAKAERICELYLTPRPGAVVCVDEKPLILHTRKHPTRVGPKAVVRQDYEYKRHGTAALIAAFDVRTGNVLAHVQPDRKTDTVMAFMEELACRYPSGPVTVIWDNLNIHHEGTAARWSSFNERHGGRFTFVHTPIHASWLNQVEIWFGIVERRLLRYGEFRTIESIRQRILGFVERWNQVEGHPFRWTWRTDRLQTQTRRAA